MSNEAAFVFGIILVVAVLMASNRVRYDFIALLVLLSLVLGDILEVRAALAGFGSSVVIMVAGLLVIGEMLGRTGVASAVGDVILKRGGGNETQLLVLIMASAALLGSVMSSTAIVAIFIPIVLRIADRTGLMSSRMLLPMSYAALISGMLTLIASPPNLVVSDELVSAGYASLGFFSFSPVGLAVLVVAIVYILVVGRLMLPKRSATGGAGPQRRSIEQLGELFRTSDTTTQTVRVTQATLTRGSTLADLSLGSSYGVRVLLRIRSDRSGRQQLSLVGGGANLQVGDLLILLATEDQHKAAREGLDLQAYYASPRQVQRWLWEVGVASVIIHPESNLIGKSLVEARFRSEFDVHVVGLRRGRTAIEEVRETPLAAGDNLLVFGAWTKIAALAERNHDFVALELPKEHAELVPNRGKAPIAITILAAMVGLSIFDVMPLVAAVILAALAAVISGCLNAEQAYRSINLPSLVLVAGMLPLADALVTTGGSQYVVDQILLLVGEAGPYVMMTIVFFLTAILGLVLSNTASAVLVAPIAIDIAETIGVSPYPMAIAVLIAASAAFSTPVSTPVVTLVVAPGGYKFNDFIKIGVPLLVLTWAVTLLVAPLIFPF